MDIRGFFGGSNKKQKLQPIEASQTETSVIVNEMTSNGVICQTVEVSEATSTSCQIVPSSCSATMTNHSRQIEDAPREIRDFVTWKSGENVPYSAIVDTFEAISRVSGRLEKESHFCKLFRGIIHTTPEDLEKVVYLVSNCVSPAYEGLELGIGDSLLVKAVCEATGRKKDAVEAAYEKEGDLGTVALASRANQSTLSFMAKPKPLSAVTVLEQLRTIALIKGDKAQARKVEKIKGLMVRCQGVEAKYIVRALQGKLRIGTAAQTVLVALAHAFVLSPTYSTLKGSEAETEEEDKEAEDGQDPVEDEEEVEEANSDGDSTIEPPQAAEKSTEEQVGTPGVKQLLEEIHEMEPPEARKLRTQRLSNEEKFLQAEIVVKRAFSECPNLTAVTNALLRVPLYDLYKTCRLEPGVPVHPMLAKPTKQITEVLRRLSGLAFTMEYKYDGERAQVHLLPDGRVKIFSRNSEDNTEKYPDLMSVIRQAKNEEIFSCVLDAEVVAFDREKGCLLPFQVLSTRKRKVEDGEEDSQKVKVVLQAFDLIFLNGKSLLQCSLRTRRQLLRNSFSECNGQFHFASFADHVENGDTTPIETFMVEACAAMCEGLMVKTLDENASYEPSKRSLNWLKLKKDYIDGMGICDSVDLVVIGGYRGRGKRVNVYGAYLMACYDPERDEFQSVCKVGTGFKDEDLTRLTEQMKPFTILSHKKPANYNVGDPLEPDDWFEAHVVWELQAADLSKSNVHKGAIGRLNEPGRGVGLRFPRYIRDREDKKPEGCTSAEQIAEMYFSQDLGEGGASGGANNNNEDDDFEL